MPWAVPAAAIAGGAILNYAGTQSAADKQAGATGKAVDASNAQYATTRSDLTPYRQAGTAALSRLQTLLGLQGGPTSPSSVSGMYAGQKFSDEASLRRAMEDNIRRQGADPGQGGFQHDIDAQIASIMASGGDVNKFYEQHPEARGAVSLNPASATGTPAEAGYGDLLKKFSQSDLESDPVYNSGLQFGLDEGTKAIERRASAGGGYDSGATLKALTRFGNDYGSTKASDAYGRFRDTQDSAFGKLSGITGLGSGATNVGVNAGMANGTNLSNLYTGLGNAQAASTLAGSNAITGGINSGIGAYYLSQLTPGAQRTTTPSLPPIGSGGVGGWAGGGV